MITRSDVSEFYSSAIYFAIFGLLAAAGVGYYYTGSIAGAGTMFVTTFILAILEISLSFDNAVVNAKVLKDMDETWKHRFLTWGMWIAVFGMRVVFPLLIVAIVAHINPVSALVLALTEPVEYERIITSAHVMVSGFGGAFLLLVGLKSFIDAEKDEHWLAWIERPLAKLGQIDSVQVALVAVLTCIVASFLPTTVEALEFLFAGILGIVTYVAVHSLEVIIHWVTGTGDEDDDAVKASISSNVTSTVVRSGLASFMYLEVLDASFSFDGVIGAFALTNNLIIIALGLGIGAFFVRSMTIHLDRTGTLDTYKYLEHGAFYAIIALGAIMYMKTFIHIPEVITGLIGAAFIGFALWDSVRFNKRQALEAPKASQ